MPRITDWFLIVFSAIFKVTGLVLRGIFLLRKKEIDWFYEGGAAAIYPDGMLNKISFCWWNLKRNFEAFWWFWVTFPCTAWESFRDLIPENERSCFVDAYSKRLNSDDKETQVRILSSVFSYVTLFFMSLLIQFFSFIIWGSKKRTAASCVAIHVEWVFFKWSCGLLSTCICTGKSLPFPFAWSIVILLLNILDEQNCRLSITLSSFRSMQLQEHGPNGRWWLPIFFQMKKTSREGRMTFFHW